MKVLEMPRATVFSVLGACTLLGVLLISSSCAVPPVPPAPMPTAGSSPNTSGLPLPSTLPLQRYEQQLYDFLGKRGYEQPTWARDKRVRDTGPYINGQYYAPHPAVRIFYSPEVYQWLKNDRQGTLPDGAMIVKEMYNPPAPQYADLSEQGIQDKMFGITVMVRDSKASKDGWFWGYWGKGQPVDSYTYPFDYPNAGFGQYCVRCHASANDHLTFASLRNIAGEAGDPIAYRVDDSWITPAAPPPANAATPAPTPISDQTQLHPQLAAGPDVAKLIAAIPQRDVNPEFVRVFNSLAPVAYTQVVTIPGVNYDHVIAGPDGPGQFLTSDQCIACHDGLGKPFGPNMYIPPTAAHSDVAAHAGVNLSPYGEWNWSLMGLSGRDPIFYAQLESEKAIHSSGNLPDVIQNLCFQCHGVMGQRQLHIDQPGSIFKEEMVHITDQTDPHFKYGALARDGVSCTVCHQMVDSGKPLQDIMTGNFVVSKPGEVEPGISQIYGPFESPATLPMSVSLGMKPVQSDYIKSAELCGSCHVIYLPIYNAAGQQVGSDFEQSTYLEWLNSSYQNEYGQGSNVQTCQQCHMTDEYHGQKLAYRIANIQDQTYPEADNLAPVEDISVPIRDNFARHSLHGINIFALEMFRQFDHILGSRKTDYMTGASSGLPNAIENAQKFATEKTATVEVQKVSYEGDELVVDVKVTNLTGHRFPSGVGFRRAFLEFNVLDAQKNVMWASGRTNTLGIIVDDKGEALPSEFLTVLNPDVCAQDSTQCQQAFEPHHQVITSENQVQIYQELVKNPEGLITSSFVALSDTIKDNRLLPLGWTPTGPPGFNSDPVWGERVVDAVTPKGNVQDDQQFFDGSGSDVIQYRIKLPQTVAEGGTVSAVLYYQSIPPYYLQQRFTTSSGPSAQRLHYLTSHLNLEGTAIENWKLAVSGDTQAIAGK